MDWLDRLLAQVNTLKELWPSFLVVWAVTGIIIWRVMAWRYQAVIEGLDHRIKLRDDSIVHLEKGKQEQARQENRPVIAPPEWSRHEPDAPSPLDHLRRWQAPEDRVFITNYSPNQLLDLFAGKTSVQEEAVARPYLDKWIEVSLPVQNVAQRDDETTVLVTDPDAMLKFIWLHFTGDRERLEIIDRGDMLAAVGRIAELSQTGMRLYGCEMIKAS